MNAAWFAQRLPFAGGEKLVFRRSGGTASFAEVIAGWQDDIACRAAFLDVLSQTRFAAFFWEMPPIARGQTEFAYECVVIQSAALAHLAPDPQAFAAELARTSETVAVFRNLGGDALLVTPRLMGDPEAYAHLGAFLRRGPEQQKHEFLQALGRAAECESRASTRPIWISTAGLGVAWMHARLDSRPKYYQHAAYRER